MEATGGIEPPHVGFADPRLTTWRRGHNSNDKLKALFCHPRAGGDPKTFYISKVERMRGKDGASILPKQLAPALSQP